MKFVKNLLFVLALALTANKAGASSLGLPVKPVDSTFSLMKKVADWQWHDLETNGWKNDQKDWTNGAMYAGMLAWAKIANDDVYYQELLKVGNDNQWKIGKRRHFADDYCIGQLYAQLYKKYKNPVFVADFKSLADTVAAIPHSGSLLWVNNVYLHEWAWCDALFMGPPAFGYLTDATRDPKYLDEACKLWWKSSDYLYNTNEHLFYRDSRYFTQKEKNGKPVFWSRGNGWVLSGMANLLSVMPANHPDRKKFIEQFKQMATRIAQLQQPDGTWHASLLDPESYPSKETSGTGFFLLCLCLGD